MTATAIILAAGQGRRMESDLPKVLHKVQGKPLVEHVIDAARRAGVDRCVIVVGFEAERVRQELSPIPNLEFALQADQLGTGHAVMMCRDFLAQEDGPVMILAGDTPLLRGESLKALLDEWEATQAACVVGTADTENNFGLGRIVRDDQGTFLRIVEQRDASPEEQQITEINTGCFVFRRTALLQALDQITSDNSQGEYYLTDCVEILRRQGETVIAARKLDIEEARGVNTKQQLAEVDRLLQTRAGEL